MTHLPGRKRSWLFLRALVAGLLAGFGGWSPTVVGPGQGVGEARAAEAPTGRCRIAWGRALADVPVSEGLRLGGLSDLGAARGCGPDRWWAITDRGPNGIVERDGEKLRTLIAPDFTPSLVLLHIDPVAGRNNSIAVERILPLDGPKGHPLTGLPTGGPGHLPVLSADGTAELSPDPDGVDPEAVVQLPDGTLWIAEEYGPSLLKVGPDGRAIERHVPVGIATDAAAVPHRETLPAAYARRLDNRGFEALAAEPDGARLWVLLQSPLDNPAKKARKTGNVRLLGFDPVAGRPTAEHLYRLGDPGDRDYLTKGAAPDDGKLCAMALLDQGQLLVLEQDDAGLARLYAVMLDGATDTLPWLPGSDESKTLEEIRDLPAAGIVPVRKRLVADLASLRETMAAQADGGRQLHGPLKLEGIAIVDERHVLVANDDDFGVHGDGPRRRRSFAWLLELEQPLAASAAK